MSALVFNTRRPIFEDARVRRAFLLLFDGEWINRSLFNGAYKRTQSFFERSKLSSHGRPADARERALLAPFAAYVKPEVHRRHLCRPERQQAPATAAPTCAPPIQLLTEAGYELKGGRLVKGGVPLSFEILAQTRQQERLMLSYARTLERLGITARIRQVDTAQYWARLKTFDFDMIQWTWGASLSPGNEQINRWSSRAAAIEGSLNYAGVKNPAADAMIEALLQARGGRGLHGRGARLRPRADVGRLRHPPVPSAEGVGGLLEPPALSPQARPLSGFDLDTWWSEPPVT